MDFASSLQDRVLLAVPKKGRLYKASLDLLEGADLQFKREHRLDIALVKNLPVALVFLPAADIPTFVGEGRCDLGITGLDQVQEHDANLRTKGRARQYSISSIASTPSTAAKTDGTDTAAHHNHPDKNRGKGSLGGCEIVMELGFGSCKLQVQAPEKGPYQSSQDLVGKIIGTSFAGLAEQHFARLEGQSGAGGEGKLRTKIIQLSGSVEAACALGVADGIVDLVESGETMRACGLKAIDTVIESTAVLIKSQSPSNPALLDLIASRVDGVITAQKFVLCQYNVERSKLDAATKITPGKRAATIVTLDDNWSAVSSMVAKKDVAVVMDGLHKLGATDVLVLALANSRGC